MKCIMSNITQKYSKEGGPIGGTSVAPLCSDLQSYFVLSTKLTSDSCGMFTLTKQIFFI